MENFARRRWEMVSQQIFARGVRNDKVLAAMRLVPRHEFLPEHLRHLAYEDRPVPISEGLTLIQPYVLAYMIEALDLKGGEKVLEISAGTGYIAAVLSRIAGQVYIIERVGQHAETAAATLIDAGCQNFHMRHDDGTKGWIEEAPFDAIMVSAATPFVPETLKNQLAPGGRMVVPVGSDPRAQELVRVTRLEKGQFTQEDLADLRFVPMIGNQGWEGEPPEPDTGSAQVMPAPPKTDAGLPGLIARHAEVFESVETADLAPLLGRIGNRRVVLIGEASHGTAEFYRFRARLTQRLIEEKGFTIVAAEADWPDAARIDHFVRHRESPPADWEAFARFPTWMWRNTEMHAFITWLQAWNAEKHHTARAGFYGLDLYSLFTSTRAIIDYLQEVDPDLAVLARKRFSCLSPWEADPAAYGYAALTGTYRECARDVTQVLVDLHRKRLDQAQNDGDRLFDAQQNAYLVTNAERYYRAMYYGSRASWNLRDGHMFETLENVMEHHGPLAKAVVWAHNSHIGDARATEMSRRGEHNLGEMCARGFGAQSYRIGFGTDHGTVAAATDWGGAMEIKTVRPSHRQSYDRQFHLTGLPGLVLPMRPGHEFDVVTELSTPRLERAIGVIYRPESELASHYFEAELPRQFDEYVWVDKTSAVTPLPARQTEGLPDTYPFGV
jgi:protein-L-isoaspartate(D-aspartate) O-methyltransferase